MTHTQHFPGFRIEPAPHRNADTRIREAFDALRSEIEAVFPEVGPDDEPFQIVAISHLWQQALHDFAKLPADA